MLDRDTSIRAVRSITNQVMALQEALVLDNRDKSRGRAVREGCRLRGFLLSFK